MPGKEMYSVGKPVRVAPADRSGEALGVAWGVSPAVYCPFLSGDALRKCLVDSKLGADPKRGQAPLPEQPGGCYAQRCRTPFRLGTRYRTGRMQFNLVDRILEVEANRSIRT